MDSIFIDDLEVYARHGVLPEEKSLVQKFLVSARLYTDTQRAGMADELSATINYSQVCQDIDDFLKSNSYNLIEAAAEQLARRLLLGYAPQLKALELTVKKPFAPIGMPLKSCSVSISRCWHRAFIALGSNMGDSEAYLKAAVQSVDENELCRLVKSSDFIVTRPYGVTDQADFLNSVMEISTLMTPVELLGLCKELEEKAGRVRTRHWGPRTLDADIIFYDSEVISLSEPSLIIPHGDMHNRDFVLGPMDQIAPEFLHPIYGKSMRVMYEELMNS